MEFKCNDLVYTYSIVYDKMKSRCDSLDFILYKENHDLKEKFSIIQSSLHNGDVYTWYYANKDKDITCKIDILTTKYHGKPLDYFYNIIYHRYPCKVIKNQIALDGGFSISEEIPYGFIYTKKQDSNTANSVVKYGLTNTGEIDYSKSISNYTVTDNDLLIVNNSFMEVYSYIATKKKYGVIMTMDNIVTNNNSILPAIYLNNLPKDIIISINREAKYSIKADYDKLGITNSLVINDEEKCQYEIDDISNTITSIHPLIYEPFCQSLYNDILLEDLPYDVMEEYEETDEYIEYRRSVFKK